MADYYIAKFRGGPFDGQETPRLANPPHHVDVEIGENRLLYVENGISMYEETIHGIGEVSEMEIRI